mmetsp:Transcript_132846/g.244229  ORF Transcript_132846/g.244229 Transcript_132846/m.244229 type:complete len:242 (+) Transcript_132846:175-900(+)
MVLSSGRPKYFSTRLFKFRPSLARFFEVPSSSARRPAARSCKSTKGATRLQALKAGMAAAIRPRSFAPSKLTLVTFLADMMAPSASPSTAELLKASRSTRYAASNVASCRRAGGEPCEGTHSASKPTAFAWSSTSRMAETEASASMMCIRTFSGSGRCDASAAARAAAAAEATSEPRGTAQHSASSTASTGSSSSRSPATQSERSRGSPNAKPITASRLLCRIDDLSACDFHSNSASGNSA